MQGPYGPHQPARDRGPAGGRPPGADARQRIRREGTKKSAQPVRVSARGMSAKKPTLFYPAALRRGLRGAADGGGGDRLDAHRLVVVAKVRLGGAFVGALGAGHLSVSHPQRCPRVRPPLGLKEQPRADPGFVSNCGSIRVEAFARHALPPHEWHRFVTRPNRPGPTGPRATRSPILPDSGDWLRMG